MERGAQAEAEIRQLWAVTVQRDAMVLRARCAPLRGLDLELSWYGGSGTVRLPFRLAGWEVLCEFAYALEQAMAGELLKVVQWSDASNQSVLQLFYRLEDHGDGDLKGRIYLRIARNGSEDQKLRIRLTRLDAYKLRFLALKAAGLV